MSHMSRLNLEIQEIFARADYELEEGDMNFALKMLNKIKEDSSLQSVMSKNQKYYVDKKIKEINQAIRRGLWIT